MKWAIDNKVYTLHLLESYSQFDRDEYDMAYAHIEDLKTKPKTETGRLTKEVRAKIAHFRRVLKMVWPRIYRFTIHFKRYRAHIEFTAEFNPKLHRNLAKFLQDTIHKELGKYRRETLQRHTDAALIFKEYEVKIMGSRFLKPRIYLEPGQLYTIALKRKVKELYLPKQPTEKTKYIGLELEFCAPVEELAFALKLWDAGVHKYAQLKKDGSLRPKMGEFGYELAILLPESHYRQHLRKLCKILDEVKARADERRCGLHVHLDMRRRRKDIVYNNLIACQNVFFTFLDPNRRDNEFCRHVDSRKFPTKFNNSREERYKTINAASYYKYKTLEVRMHEGSVNFKDITNWMNLLIKIANHKTRIKKDINELTQLRKHIRIEPNMGEFFQDKVCYWQLQGPQRRGIPSSIPRAMTEMTTATAERVMGRFANEQSDTTSPSEARQE